MHVSSDLQRWNNEQESHPKNKLTDNSTIIFI